MSSEDFKSLIVTDPDLIDEGIDVSDLRTQTDTNPRLLGAIEGYPGISYDPTSYSYLSDLNRLFASGLPTIDTSQPTTPPSGEGSGDGGQAITPITTPTQPDSVAGFDPGVTPGPSGFIGLDPEYDLDPKDYVDDYTYSPFTTNNTIQMENIGSPGIEDIMPGEFAEFGPVTIKEAPTIGDYDDVTTVEGALSKVRPPGFPQDYSVTGALGVDPLEKMDFVSGADVDNPEGLLSKLGLKGFDPAEALIKTAINAAIGKPVTLFIDILKDIMPPMDPRQKALNEMYDVKDGTIQSGLMKGYNPVSGGGLYTLSGGQYGNEPTYGLQEAYDERIDDVTNTLQDKYGFTNEEIDQIKAGNITENIIAKGYSETMGKTTNNIQKLTDLVSEKEKEKKRLDLFSGDIDERDQMLEDISLQNKIDAGIQAADDDKGDDIFGFKDLDDQVVYSDYQDIGETSDSYNYPDRKQLVDSGTITPLEDDFESLVDQVDIPKQVESTTMSDISLAEMPMQEFEDLINNVDDFGKSIDLIESRTRGQEYLDDLDEIGLSPTGSGKEVGYVDYTEQEKADIAAGKKTPKLGELIDFGLNSVSGNITPIDEFSDEAYMVGDTSTTTGNMDDVLGKMPDDKSDDAPTGVDAGTADVQDYFDDYSYSPDNDSGSQANIDTSGDFAGKGTGASGPAGGGGGNDPGGSKGCVIATHAVNSGAFTKDTKREAVRWCVKNLHRKWWGEAVRRGYKYYGQKAIEQGKAKNHYQEFKDYVAFGTGKRRTLKTGWTFVYRTVQFFLKGLTL